MAISSPTIQRSFVELNLRANPFGERDRAERAELAIVELGDLPDQLRQPHTAVQFMGQHGRGKSTHLIALHGYFPQSPYVQLHRGDALPALGPGIHFIDSIEMLGRSQRRQALRNASSLALTTHKDLRKDLQKCGFHVITRHITQRSPQHLFRIFSRRLNAARYKPGPIPNLTLEQIMQLQAIHGDDIRAMEFDLYLYFQHLKDEDHTHV